MSGHFSAWRNDLDVHAVASWTEPSARRTFRAHDDRSDWLHEPGSCDITVDIDVDQLQVDHPASTVGTQAAFLRRHGIDELVEEGRAAWRAGAAVGDLAALWARSRIREAEALLDPDAMGGFAALEWSF
jgi:SAM-dependent MidA family methyltransferase